MTLLSRRRFTASSLGLAAAAAAGSPVFGQTPAADQKKTDPAAAVEQVMKASMTPGAAVMLVTKDAGPKPLVMGYADVAQQTPVAPDMTFRIGSLTKTFMATVILQLVGEGKMKLDDKVSALSSTFDALPNAKDVTVRQMLDMTSGWGDFLVQQDCLNARVADSTRHYEPSELLEYAAKDKPVGKPGEQYSYSNTSYLVLGMLAEELTGSPYDKLITERVINKLELKSTSIPTDAVMPDPFARGYRLMPEMAIATPGAQATPMATPAIPQISATPVTTPVAVGDPKIGPYDVTDFNPSLAAAAGSMVSSVEDLAKFIKAVGDGSLLSEEMRKEQLKGKISSGQAKYGLGVMFSDKMIGHNGAIDGYQAFAATFPTHDIQIAVLTNAHSTRNGDHAAASIAGALLGA